ncbi:hypothetical protein BH09PSE4_BH09PSE4_17630 [soil metagenome]
MVSACSDPAPQNDSVVNTALFSADTSKAPTTATTDNAAAIAAPDYSGRWTGVEGMYLVVAKGQTAGSYTLEMQYDLDHKGNFTGTANSDSIAFTRDGNPEVLRPTDGAATGLKYLSGKQECLTVKTGEGYCRD